MASSNFGVSGNIWDVPRLEEDRMITPGVTEREILNDEHQLDVEGQQTTNTYHDPSDFQLSIPDPGKLYLKIESLTDKCSLLSDQNEHLIATTEELQEVNMAITKALQSSKKTARLFLANYDAQFAKIQAENSQLKQALAEVVTHRAEMHEAIAGRNRIISRQGLELADQKRIISGIDSSKSFEVLYTTGKILIDGLRVDIQQKADHIQQVEIKSRALEKKVEDLEEKVKHNGVQLGWILPIVTQKTLLIEKHEETIKESRGHMNDKDRLIASLCRDVSQRNQIITEQKAELKQMNGDLDNIRLELHLQKANNEQLFFTLTVHDNTISHLRRAIADKDENLYGYESICRINDGAIEALFSGIDELETKLKFWMDKVPKSIRANQALKEMNDRVVRGRDYTIQGLERELATQRETVKKLWLKSLAKELKQEVEESRGWNEKVPKAEEVEEVERVLPINAKESELKGDEDTGEGDKVLRDYVEVNNMSRDWDTMTGIEDGNIQW